MEVARVKCSIVIPVYNVRDYLRECLDSCLRQELEGLEIICVDDGSTDGSADILSEYARRDSRVRIVTLGTNCGLYQARKRGVEAATGEYLLHLDSDDLLEGTSGLQRLVATADANHVDLLQFGTRAFVTEAGDARLDGRADDFNARAQVRDEREIPFDEYERRVYVNHTALETMWGKLFRRLSVQETYADLPDGFCFMAEDRLFMLAHLARPKRVASSAECIYAYRLGSGQSVDGASSPERRDRFIRSIVFADGCLERVPRCRDSRWTEAFLQGSLKPVMRQVVFGCSCEEALLLVMRVGAQLSEKGKALLASAVREELARRRGEVDALTGRLMLLGLAVGRLLRKISRRGVDGLSAAKRQVKEMIR